MSDLSALKLTLNNIVDLLLNLSILEDKHVRKIELKKISRELKVAVQLKNDNCKGLIVGQTNNSECGKLNNALADLIKTYNETPIDKPINTPTTELNELKNSIKILRSGVGGRRKRKTHRKRKALRKTHRKQ